MTEDNSQAILIWQISMLIWPIFSFVAERSHGSITSMNYTLQLFVVSCKCGSAKHCVTDDHAFQWKHGTFRVPAKPKALNRYLMCQKFLESIGSVAPEIGEI
jgi:hypothetical protein